MKKPVYILLHDTMSIFQMISPDIPLHKNKVFQEANQKYLREIKQYISEALEGAVTINIYDKHVITREIGKKLKQLYISDTQSVCVCFDRFLLQDIEKNDTYKNRFFRFQICRSDTNSHIPRPGHASLEQQIDDLISHIPDLSNKHLILVDDGIFSGGTVQEFITLLKHKHISISISYMIGYIGNSSKSMELGFPIDILKPTSNLLDWVDIRDFSPIGGKIKKTSISPNPVFSVPYIPPWSFGDNASLHTSKKLFSMSSNMLRSYRTLIHTYEHIIGKKLNFEMFTGIGFTLPESKHLDISVSPKTFVEDYLNNCIELLKRQKGKKIVVFDMDGTLYRLNGEKNTYTGSSLEKQVVRNAKKFIIEVLGKTQKEAKKIIQDGLKDSVGLSAYISKKFNVHRNDYFDGVWNINPETHIQMGSYAKSILEDISKYSDIAIFLVTSAPRVWTHSVLSFLGIRHMFDSIFTAEQFNTKTDIYKILAKRYGNKQVTVIGDQLETDILPATNLGMRAFHITSPEDLPHIVTEILSMYRSIS